MRWMIIAWWIVFQMHSALLAAEKSADKAADARPELHVTAVNDDFEVTGDGSHSAWKNVSWTPLHRRPEGTLDYTAQVKLLYSKTGLYVLMDGTDRTLTASMSEDFMDLWKEDVFEFFLWPDEKWPVYFEYEISPLGRELPILIPNFEGKFLGWTPWNYEGARKTRKAVHLVGDGQNPVTEAKTGQAIGGWRAEVFVPYSLLEPLQNVPPKPGSRWRANFYRVDYDRGSSTSWDWSRVGPSFHEYEKFGTLIFD